jgi:hypothetical protein
MPFEVGRKFLEDYSKDRADQIAKGERIKWSTAPVSALSEMITTNFDREEDNQTWQSLHGEKHPDIAKLMGVSNRIAWLCSCARDVRIQFMAAGNRARKSVDHTRYNISLLKWVEKGLKRFKALNAERDKGVQS